MSFFPIFVELSNKNVLVVGGGKVAYRKIVTLLKFTQNIIVIAPNIIDEIKALNIPLYERKFKIEDLSNKFLVITATNDKSLNQEILENCKSKGIMCNSSTSTQKDNCIFPSIVKYNDITIGITTNGKSPSISKKIRKDIEENISLKEYSNNLYRKR